MVTKRIQLSAKPRGFHIVTNEVLSAIPGIKLIEYGLFNLFIKHTSASLTINENADATVRADAGSRYFLRKLVLGIPAQPSGKNLTRPLMPSAPQTSCVRATSPLPS
ncbi:hypothetical protein BMR07_04570 [Methylococcaceae bacterium CS1]|nr:hypothetical protein BMR07_04570 [Methylococcaceae bacterium CS1]TXL12025.1 hypothetical protein BMR08_01720 [Methylococcaceae bacterium CS2]